jgi:hypothetical protein
VGAGPALQQAAKAELAALFPINAVDIANLTPGQVGPIDHASARR